MGQVLDQERRRRAAATSGKRPSTNRGFGSGLGLSIVVGSFAYDLRRLVGLMNVRSGGLRAILRMQCVEARP